MRVNPSKYFIDLNLLLSGLIDLALSHFSLLLTSLPIFSGSSMKFFAPDVLNTPRNYLTFSTSCLPKINSNLPRVFRLMDDV